jgi:hypothetical protein
MALGKPRTAAITASSKQEHVDEKIQFLLTLYAYI